MKSGWSIIRVGSVFPWGPPIINVITSHLRHVPSQFAQTRVAGPVVINTGQLSQLQCINSKTWQSVTMKHVQTVLIGGRGHSWWRHQMETFSALLAICVGNSPVSPQKGQWRGALMLTLICTRINGWVNNGEAGEAGDLRRHLAHYDGIVMELQFNKLNCTAIYRHVRQYMFANKSLSLLRRNCCGAVVCVAPAIVLMITRY